MRTLTTTFIAALGFCAGAAAEDLKPAEITRARQYLEQTRDAVTAATAGLSEAQWSFKPADDRWSIAEIVEHMVLTQELILGPVRQQLAAAPAPSADHDARAVDEVVVAKLPDRSKKFQAPEPLKPTGTWSESAALERFRKNCARLIEYLESTPDLRQHILDAPPLAAISGGQYKAMDGYEWLLGVAGHTERHTKQLLEVKADPHFPRQ
jgi:DinB superfamily